MPLIQNKAERKRLVNPHHRLPMEAGKDSCGAELGFENCSIAHARFHWWMLHVYTVPKTYILQRYIINTVTGTLS